MSHDLRKREMTVARGHLPYLNPQKKKVTVICPGSFAVTRAAALFTSAGKAAQSGTDQTGNMQ